MKVKEFLKKAHSNHLKSKFSKFTANLLDEADVCKVKTFYDEVLIERTVSVLEMEEVLPKFPSCCKLIHITASADSLLKIVRSIFMHEDETPIGIYLQLNLPESLSLDEAERVFSSVNDICLGKAAVYHAATIEFSSTKKYNLLLLMFFN